MSDSDDDFREEQHTRPRSRGSEAVSRTHSVPRGHCLLHERWRHSQVGQNIGRVMTVKYVGGMGAVDFQPSSNTYVMYLAEADIIGGLENMKSKFEKISEIKRRQENAVIVTIYLKTDLTIQYFKEFQNEIVMKMGLAIVAVTSTDQLGQMLQQFQLADSKSNPFQFSVKKSGEMSSTVHKDILLAVCKIPGLGEKKSRNLLNSFDSLRKISRAKEQELAPVIGPNLAKGVEDFFKRKNTT